MHNNFVVVKQTGALFFPLKGCLRSWNSFDDGKIIVVMHFAASLTH